MAAELRWSARARQDLLDIYVAIGLDSPTAAERIYDRLTQRAASLREQPRLGPGRDDIRPRIRMLVERPYLILYEIFPDREDEPASRIDIIRVIDGRRDLGEAV